MDKQEVFETLKEIFMEVLDLSDGEISMQSNIKEDLSIDSLDLVEVVLDIEREFDIDLPEDLIADIETVEDIVDYIIEHTM